MSLADTMNLLFAERCNCQVDVPFYDGNKPEYYDSVSLALKSMSSWFLLEQIEGHFLYWSVHLNGRHILASC